MSSSHSRIIDALQPLPPDERDFSHDVVFGSVSREELPEGDFFVSEPLLIKDQDKKFSSDFCGGFASAAVSEDQELVELNGEFSFQAAKKLIGGDAWKSWGLNLRDVCKAGCDIGFLEQEYYPFENRDDINRDFVANPANWPEDLDMLAADHRKASYFIVDGPHDTFDNFRSVMWKNRSESRSILTGVAWRDSWTLANNGIIPRTGWENEQKTGHAIKIFGQILLKDPENPGKMALYLIAQLSNGSDIGDKGLFYFPREVVNSQFIFGAFTFKDLPKEKAQYLNENGLNINDSRTYKLLKVIFNWFGRLIGLKK